MTENSETLLSKKGVVLALIGIFALYFTQCAFGIIWRFILREHP